MEIRQIQFRLGQTQIYRSDLKYVTEIFEQNQRASLAKEYGNAVNSLFHSGLIRKPDFMRCYNTYVIEGDCGINSVEEDSKERKLTIEFTIDGNPNIYYDFVILFEYQKELLIDRYLSKVTKNDALSQI